MTKYVAEILNDGRGRVHITDRSVCREGEYYTSVYTTVRNIDGSNRLMRDGGGWTFLPQVYEYGACAALAQARGDRYPFPHCVPIDAVIEVIEAAR
jgi:hypothetical protein